MEVGRGRGRGIIAAVADQDAWIGRELDGRYRVVELLGEGGMGSVYIAEHRTLRKQVAVKTIRPEFAVNRQAEARFTREAMATGKLDHPHVVSAIDYGRLPDGSAYLVTALVRGESLGRRLARAAEDGGGVPARVAGGRRAGRGARGGDRAPRPQAGQHPARAPRRRVAAREGGRLRGRAHDRVDAGGEAALPITRLGAVIGTPGYMAPEQATGGTIDARVDLYALGVILWECCTGQPLWDTAERVAADSSPS
jgi:serine/threonine protein kinase